MAEWITFAAKATGSSHKQNNIQCQDSFDYTCKDNGKTLFIAVSDGAGSRKYSDWGSKEVVNYIVSYFEENPFFVSREAQLEELISGTVFPNAKKRLNDFASKMEEPIDVKELGCTIILLIANEKFVFCAHIGDGSAGAKFKSGWESMLVPDKGEYSNETNFITDWCGNRNEIGFKFFSGRPEAVIVCTDGFESYCFEIRPGLNTPHTPWLDARISELVGAKDTGYQLTELQKEWQKLVETGSGIEEIALEPDDKTCVLAIWK